MIRAAAARRAAAAARSWSAAAAAAAAAKPWGAARGGAAVAVSLAILLVAGDAMAARPRVALTAFAGPGAQKVREAVASRLAARYEVVLSPASRGGAAGRAASRWASLARRLNAVAVVDGQVARGSPWRARLMVRDGEDGSARGTLVWSSDRPAELLQDVLREGPGKVSALVARTRAAAVARERAAGATAEEEIVDAGPPAVAAAAPESESESAETLLEASLGPRIISRTLAFTDNAAGAPGYRLAAAPALGGELVLYPGARTAGVLRHLGLAGSWEGSLGATTRGRESGSAQSTQHRAYQAGLRIRMPLHPLGLRLGVDYGAQRFEVDLALDRPALSPAVRYRFLRPSLAARLNAGRVGLGLTGGYLHLLSARGLADPGRFPRASVMGVETAARVTYRVRADLDVEAALDFRRYVYSMKAAPGDRLLVGGAVDDYLGAGLMLTYRQR